MNKEKSILGVSTMLFVLILTIVIAMSGCIENTNNTAHSKNSTDNTTTGKKYNVIVTVSNVSLNASLLKILVKNIEADSKISEWREVNKVNQTDNKSIYSDKIYTNLDISTETNKANNTDIVINALVYKNLNLTMSKIFRFERSNGDKNKTEISNCKAKCEIMCKEKCEVNNTNNERCVRICEQNLYSDELIKRCQNEINERCKIKCASEGVNQTRCSFRCKMNSLQPCMEKYVADERNICISKCKANASSQCSNLNFECYNKCLSECKE